MVLDAVSNFVRGNTDAAVGTDDTTVSVEDASIFPDPATDGEFNVVIWDVDNFPRPDQDGDVEIMRVTARDTDTNELTVTRGQEMTSAAAHPEGSAIHLSPTAKMFSDIESTFSDFWDAGTQELTADVNNTNTTTTALEAGSVSAESLDNGVSGDGNTITAVYGDEGERRPILSLPLMPGEEVSTTSTDFVAVGDTNLDSIQVGFDNLYQTTNANVDVLVSISGNASSGDVTVRVKDSPETEISGTGNINGQIGSYRGLSDFNGTDNVFAEFKSNDGDEAAVTRLLVTFWEEIGQ